MVKTVKVTFSDINQSWVIHIRKGIAEVVEYESREVDTTLALPRKVWAVISVGDVAVKEALSKK